MLQTVHTTSTGRGAFQAKPPVITKPHLPQNFVPAGYSVPQREQRTRSPAWTGVTGAAFARTGAWVSWLSA